MPNECDYLADGDVLRLWPQRNQVRVLYRRNSFQFACAKEAPTMWGFSFVVIAVQRLSEGRPQLAPNQTYTCK
jgi:hypothetical protein